MAGSRHRASSQPLPLRPDEHCSWSSAAVHSGWQGQFRPEQWQGDWDHKQSAAVVGSELACEQNIRHVRSCRQGAQPCGHPECLLLMLLKPVCASGWGAAPCRRAGQVEAAAVDSSSSSILKHVHSTSWDAGVGSGREGYGGAL